MNTLRKLICIAMLLFFVNFSVYSQAFTKSNSVASNSSKSKVFLSVYLSRIFTYSTRNNYFDIKYELTLKHAADVHNILSNINLMNAMDNKLIYQRTRLLKDGWALTTAGFNARIYTHFALNKYPFDRQYLNMSFDLNNINSKVKELIPTDQNNIKAFFGDETTSFIPEWRVLNAQYYRVTKSYYPMFSSVKSKEKTTLSDVVFKVTLQRYGYRLFVGTFVPLYLAVVLCFIALCIPARKGFFNPRFSLLGASVWALVGNHLLTYPIFQHAHRFSLTDQLQIVSALYVIFSLFFVLITSFYWGKVERNIMSRAGRYTAFISLFIYIGLNVYFILNAI